MQMTPLKDRPPFSESPMSQFLTKRIEELASVKTQRMIATECGYDKPNIVSMFKRGDARVPLEKVPILAKALDTDVGHLFRLALEQYWPNMHDSIQEIFGNTVSANEVKWVKKIREVSANMDPDLTQVYADKLEDVLRRSP